MTFRRSRTKQNDNRFTRWWRSLFAWHAVRSTGVWVYCENTITGQRKAVKKRRGYQPLDLLWLRDGDKVITLERTIVLGSEDEHWA